jgi:L-alanine-DL-glutamate epimerase-like enolase superfamily enzyme
MRAGLGKVLRRLSVEAPLRLEAGTIALRGLQRARVAVRISVRDSDGTRGIGEAVPLPGYSRDDAAAVERVLAAIAARTRAGGLELGAQKLEPEPSRDRVASVLRRADFLDAVLRPHADLLAGAPSARFALETAIVDVLARREAIGAARWLADGHPLHEVPVSRLLPDDDRAAVEAAAAAVEDGFTVLKAKIARSDRDDAAEDALLARIRSAADAAPVATCGDERKPTRRPVRLRLDANGAIAPLRVVARLEALRRFGVELVEEPVGGAALLDLPELPLRWAADESLADAELAMQLMRMPAHRRPAAVVLKPSLLGLARCLRIAADASTRAIGVIVTHAFDGDIGHAAACALAASLPQPPWPCGLAPHAGLRRHLLALPRLPVPQAEGLGDSSLLGAPDAA